jgi:hypothetical protein
MARNSIAQTLVSLLILGALVYYFILPKREGFSDGMGLKKVGASCGQNSECATQFCHAAVCT